MDEYQQRRNRARNQSSDLDRELTSESISHDRLTPQYSDASSQFSIEEILEEENEIFFDSQRVSWKSPEDGFEESHDSAVERLVMEQRKEENEIFFSSGGDSQYDDVSSSFVEPERVASASNAGWGELGNRENLSKEQIAAEREIAQEVLAQSDVPQQSSPDNEPGIAVTSATDIAVSGTTTNYVVDLGEHLESSDEFTYQWTVINDPSSVIRERENNNPNGISKEVTFPETRSAQFEAPWAFSGTHTVVVRVFDRGELRDTYSYEQVVQNPAELAADALNHQTPQGLQPDAYLAQLELSRQIAESQGAEEKQLQQIAEAIANAEEKLGITTDNPTGGAEPITATLIPTAQPQPVPLQLYLKPEANGIWAIVDLTDPGSVRTYRGRGNQSAESTSISAITHAWENFIARNPHPEGQIAASISHTQTGASVPILRNEHSDGISELGKIGQWFSRIGLVAGIGAIALTVAPIPGSRVAAGLIIVSGASAATAGGLNIADRLQHGDFEWDGETALDIVDIAAGLAVGVGTAVQLGGKAASVARLRNTVLISEGIETGSDAASGVILTAIHYRRIEEIRNDSSLTNEQKQTQIQQELTVASANGGLIVIGAVGLRRGNKGDYLDVSPDGIGTSARAGENGIRITPENLEEFRSIGFSKAEIETLNNPDTTRAEKNALYARRDANYKNLYQAYGQEGIEQLAQKLGAKGLRQIYGATGVDGLKKVERIIELERQGKVKGFDDWIEFLNSGNRRDDSIADVVGELDVTRGATKDLNENEVINIGGDNQVVRNEKGELPKSFDLTVENKETGEVLRNIEVHRPDTRLATRHRDFSRGINHAVDKATIEVANPNTGRLELIRNPNLNGDIEAAVNVDIPEAGTVVGKKGKKKYFGESGTYGTEFGKGGGDLYQDIINEQLAKSKNPNAEKYLDRINIIDRNGTLRATIEKSGTAQTGYSWTIKRHR